MNDAPFDSTREEEVDYLIDLLRLNPADSSTAIMARRNERLGIGAAAVTHVNQDTHLGYFLACQHVEKELGTLRAEFWVLSEDELTEKLNEIQTSGLPHFLKVVERLKVVADHRNEIESLDAGGKHDADFLSALKTILIEPASKTVQAREKMITLFSRVRSRSRVRRMVIRISKEIPQIHELEEGWFEKFGKRSLVGRLLFFMTTPWGLAICAGAIAWLLGVLF